MARTTRLRKTLATALLTVSPGVPATAGAISPAVGPNYRYLWVDRPEFLYELGL